MAPRRPVVETPAPDASRLSFPAQLVLTVISVAISVTVSVLGATWSLKSDVRDLSTRMELREKVYANDTEALKGRMADQERKIELMRYDLSQLTLALAKEGKTK